MKIQVSLSKFESKAISKTLSTTIKKNIIPKDITEYNIKNRAINSNSIIDCNGSTEINLFIKPFFTEWILRAFRPAILTLFSSIEQAKDIIDDVNSVVGSTSVVVNGELKNPQKDIEDPSEDELESEEVYC